MGFGDIIILTTVAAATVLIVKNLSQNRSRCCGECCSCKKSSCKKSSCKK